MLPYIFHAQGHKFPSIFIANNLSKSIIRCFSTVDENQLCPVMIRIWRNEYRLEKILLGIKSDSPDSVEMPAPVKAQIVPACPTSLTTFAASL